MWGRESGALIRTLKVEYICLRWSMRRAGWLWMMMWWTKFVAVRQKRAGEGGSGSGSGEVGAEEVNHFGW